MHGLPLAAGRTGHQSGTGDEDKKAFPYFSHRFPPTFDLYYQPTRWIFGLTALTGGSGLF
jgi:hypothetical protein